MLPTFIKFATSRRFVAADDDETKKRKNNKNGTGKSCCVASSEPETAAPVQLLPEVTVPTDDGAAPGLLLLVSGSGHDESLSSSLVTPSPETKTVFDRDHLKTGPYPEYVDYVARQTAFVAQFRHTALFVRR